MPDNDSQTALRGRPKDPAKREAILDAAKALVPVQQALPKGANPVHPGTYSSAAARDALAAAAK